MNEYPMTLDAAAVALSGEFSSRWSRLKPPEIPSEDDVWGELAKLGFRELGTPAVNYVRRRAVHWALDMHYQGFLKDSRWQTVLDSVKAELDALRPPPLEFKITIHPVRYLKLCQDEVDRRRRGMVGFHNSDSCASCSYTDDGYEMWGENGHCQGHYRERPDDALLARWDAIAYRDPRLNKTVFEFSDRVITYLR